MNICKHCGAIADYRIVNGKLVQLHECKICASSGIYFTIKPPEGSEFRECPLCASPYLHTGNFENCLMCEMKKEQYDD